MTLSPAFDKETLEYSATTENASNSITAVAEHEEATVTITCGEDEYDSGDSITWKEGENEVTVKVVNGSDESEYVVTVTKSTPKPGEE